jgi:phosphoglycolate phosphatase-like HAD superfamily hydrolase
MTTSRRVPVFDLDGTLLDSDDALERPFVALGVRREDIRFGEPVAEACRRLGVPVEAYVGGYDPALSRPFPGVLELLELLERWAVCSNKHPVAGYADLARWGWAPEVALFSDAFGWADKELGPVLDELGLGADDVLYVGDSPHDRAVAERAGVAFAVAGWNQRAAGLGGGIVLRDPVELLELLE